MTGGNGKDYDGGNIKDDSGVKNDVDNGGDSDYDHGCGGWWGVRDVDDYCYGGSGGGGVCK